VNLVARLGTGHHRNSVHFIDPDTKKSMFTREMWSEEFEEVYNDTLAHSACSRMISETINAEGDGGINNYLRRSIPAIARCSKAACIISRKHPSKAVERIENEFKLIIPYSSNLNKDYQEFREYFEPMSNPSHAYCGQDEFNHESRKQCNSNCEWTSHT
jgi:hypothetical protein